MSTSTLIEYLVELTARPEYSEYSECAELVERSKSTVRSMVYNFVCHSGFDKQESAQLR